MVYYLTYEEYSDMGGTLDETLFDNLRLDAQGYIDWYTFNRLWNETEIPERVKICMYQLINLLNAQNNLVTPEVSTTNGINVNAEILTQSNDGVSTQYAVFSADMKYSRIKNEINGCVTRYLQGVVNSAGRKLLYKGLYPDE